MGSDPDQIGIRPRGPLRGGLQASFGEIIGAEDRMRFSTTAALTGCAANVMVAALIASSAAQAPAAGGTVTFTKDVAPILQKSCQNCHRPGSIGPMSLIHYEDARPWVRSLRSRLAQRQLPPWHLDRTVGIRSFKDDPSLSDKDIATIIARI